MSPIDSYDGASTVFTFGPDTFGTVLGVLIAVALLVLFFVRMIAHENDAYQRMIAHQQVEPGPVIEAEPTVY